MTTAPNRRWRQHSLWILAAFNGVPDEHNEGFADGPRHELPSLNHECQSKVQLDNVVG